MTFALTGLNFLKTNGNTFQPVVGLNKVLALAVGIAEHFDYDW